MILNLPGVMLLFVYVIPQRIRTDGVILSWKGNKPDQKLIKLERNWDFWSGVDLWCVIIGIALQGFGVWI
jgi:hypothetical protein